MKSNEFLETYELSLEMVPLTLRELFNIENVPCDIYLINKGLFKVAINEDGPVDRKMLGQMLNKNGGNFYVLKDEHQALIKKQQDQLRIATRSLSIGNTLENAKRQMGLLTLNMYYLYLDALNNDTLNLQVQSAGTLSKVLLDNLHYHKELYNDYIKQKHHYILAQPLLSSLFLLGLLKNSKSYIDSDIEGYFLASYLKDIGMSFIPTENFEKEDLEDNEKKQILRHTKISVNILNGRTPLKPHHLKIVEHHHAFSDLRSELSTELQNRLNPSKDVMLGFETLSTAIMDITAAMLSERPYRESDSLLESLEFVKNVIAAKFPMEFKLIVQFFKKYYT